MNDQVDGCPTAAGQVGETGAIPFRGLDGDLATGCLLICDHASNAFPGGADVLGLGPDDMGRHIAYDIGAAEVTRHVSEILGTPAIMSGFSRLLIDPNRGIDDPTLIMRISDGAVVPANRDVDEAVAAQRIRDYYEPYHGAIDGLIEEALAAGAPPVLVSIHSFTDRWKDHERPWHVTVLWDNDPRLACPLIEALRAEPGIVVGENEPYSGALKGDTLYRHGTSRGLAHALLEIRQDLIGDAAGQRAWGERLARVLCQLLGDRDLMAEARKIHHFGSRGDLKDTDPVAALPVQKRDQTMTDTKDMTTELEAAAFRRLVAFLRDRTDVQNIDLMNLAGFCRNCLSNWYRDAAEERGLEMTKEAAREIVYGMPYDEWKAKHQTEATQEQLAQYEVSRPTDGH